MEAIFTIFSTEYPLCSTLLGFFIMTLRNRKVGIIRRDIFPIEKYFFRQNLLVSQLSDLERDSAQELVRFIRSDAKFFSVREG